MSNSSKTGLALGSGGARGWAHIGAIQELNKLGIQPFCIAGTSIGSIAGALYATQTLDLAEDLALNLNWKDLAHLFLEMSFLRSGLVSGKNFMKLLQDIIPARSFEELAYPLAVVATDLKAERAVVFKEGDLFNAIRASISIPGIFTPVEHECAHLVDGGLTNPLPVSICKAMGADRVIAIDVNLRSPQPRENPEQSEQAEQVVAEGQKQGSNALKNLQLSIAKLLPQLQTPISEMFLHWFTHEDKQNQSLSIIDVLTRSFRLSENEVTRNIIKLHPPEILIQPAVGDIMTLEFYRGREAIEAGRAAVREKRDEVETLLKKG